MRRLLQLWVDLHMAVAAMLSKVSRHMAQAGLLLHLMAELVMIRCTSQLRSMVQAGLHLELLLHRAFHLEALLRQAWHHASTDMILWIATTDLADETSNGKADFRTLQRHHFLRLEHLRNLVHQSDEYALTTTL